MKRIFKIVLRYILIFIFYSCKGYTNKFCVLYSFPCFIQRKLFLKNIHFYVFLFDNFTEFFFKACVKRVAVNKSLNISCFVQGVSYFEYPVSMTRSVHAKDDEAYHYELKILSHFFLCSYRFWINPAIFRI